MAYLPKSEVEENIKVRVRQIKSGKSRRDYEAYFGVDPFDHKPVRVARRTKEDIMAAIRDFYQRHSAGGDAAVRLTAIQALDAKNAFDLLASTGLKTSLYDTASAYIDAINERKTPAVGGDKKVADAFDEFYDAKNEGADKQKTNATTGKWVRSIGDRTLVSVTAKEIVDYLDANYAEKKPKTYNSHLLYIKTFLNWCCKDEREYLAKNPIRSVKFKPEPWEEPDYMKPEEVERLFRLLEAHKSDTPELLAYAIVSFFCGCRGVEILRMASDPEAAKIDLEGATIRIAKAKGFQQGKRPRAFTIHPTALAWMKSFDFLHALGEIDNDTQEEIYRAARTKGIPVFQNCGRHTFITYHVAAYGDPSKTTAMVGTSEKMRAENYCGLASKAEGEAYFKIMPTA